MVIFLLYCASVVSEVSNFCCGRTIGFDLRECRWEEQECLCREDFKCHAFTRECHILFAYLWLFP